MDSFTFNKYAGAVLGTCLVGMGLGLVGEAIYSPGKPEKPGYALPEPKPEGAGGAAKPAEVPLAVLLTKADAKKGEADAKVCAACHNFEEGAGAKVGPDLYGVVDRPKGSAAGFDYSAGLKAKGGKWTYADLNEFITKPAAYISGTKMGYAGQESPEKRADILAYLQTLSKSPVPFPAPTGADKKPAAGGEAKGEAAKPAEGGKDAAAGGGDVALVKMIAEADPKKGQSDAQVCSACHNFKEGAGTLVGPDLYGVVDRPKGSVAGFDYSAGMKAKGGNWTYADLNEFLTKPQAYVKGTKMGFPGEANEKKRATIIAFLRTLAPTPAPLPGGDAKPAPAADKQPAAEAPAKPAEPAPPAKPAAPPAPPPAAAPAPPAPPPTPEKSTPAAASTPLEGSQPPLGADPQYPTEKVEPPPLPKSDGAAPSLTQPGDDAGSDKGQQPYSAPSPEDAK